MFLILHKIVHQAMATSNTSAVITTCGSLNSISSPVKMSVIYWKINTSFPLDVLYDVFKYNHEGHKLKMANNT